MNGAPVAWRPPGVAGLATLRIPLIVPLTCIAFMIGIVLAVVPTTVPPQTWGALGLALSLAAIAGGVATVLRTRRVPFAFAAAGALGLGMIRAAAALDDPVMPWVQAPDGPVEVIVVVEAPPQTRGASAVVTARVERIDSPAGLNLPSGRVQLTLALPGPEDGERLEVRGRFFPTSTDTPYDRRLLAQGISAVAWHPQTIAAGQGAQGWLESILKSLRSGIDATIRRMLPEPHATLLAGLLLGSGSGLSDEFAQALRASGTTHIVVVSGYNITLVAGALLAVFGGFRGYGALAALVAVWAFVALTGGAAPSVRAAFMGTAALVATRSGRGADPLGALGLASALMLVLDPRLALDLGFQLSVAATLGLIALQPRVARLMPGLPPVLREPLAGTIAAQLATLPLLAATFHQLSVVAPLSNLLAAPAVPLATIGGGIGVALAGPIPVLAPFVGALLMIPTGYLVAIIEATAAIPGATTPVGDITPVAAWLYALALIAWATAPTPEGRALLAHLRSPRVIRVAAAAGAALIGAAIASSATAAPSEQPGLSLTVLDVGGGEAVFVRAPGGTTMLIDGGPSPSALLAQLGRRLGLTERQLSIAVVTTTDSSGLAGAAAAAERYAPMIAIAPPGGVPSPLHARWRAAMGDHSVSADSALTVDVEPGVTLEVLPTRPIPAFPRSKGPFEPSLALRLVHGNRAFLIIRQPASEILGGLIEDGWPVAADVVVVPAGEDDRRIGLLIADRVAPRIAVFSAPPRGKDRGAGPLAIPGLAASYGTDTHGSVEVRSDGKRLTVRPERMIHE